MKETLSIKVAPEEKVRLQALAAQRQTTVSQLMREALDRLAEEENSNHPSCYELVHDLFEDSSKLGASSEGDRSTNKRHLLSFGKNQ